MSRASVELRKTSRHCVGARESPQGNAMLHEALRRSARFYAAPRGSERLRGTLRGSAALREAPRGFVGLSVADYVVAPPIYYRC